MNRNEVEDAYLGYLGLSQLFLLDFLFKDFRLLCVTPFIGVEIWRRSGRTYCLHVHIFYPEDKDSLFFRTVGKFLPGCFLVYAWKAQLPRLYSVSDGWINKYE